MVSFLKHLPVLIVDCQATGANPDNGYPLEIGWMIIRDAASWKPLPEAVFSYLIRLPEGVEIPKRVQQVTGITPEMVSDAISPRTAWKRLCRAADSITGSTGCCSAVIHFCRYETPFLQRLHRQISPKTPFPLQIICTHEIVRLLLPELPRKGLRAVAGYFGHSVTEIRRAAEHVLATGVIWYNTVNRLEAFYGIRTLDDLAEWLKRTPVIRKGERSYPMDRAVRSRLPNAPGVYRMRRSNKDVLYVGKARSLKHRVNSYFQKHRKHPEHILEMLTQAKDLSVQVTGSALEAAIVEADEIKSLAPPYNIALREKDRGVWFCSKDFSRISDRPDDTCCLGPLPSADLIKALDALAGLVSGDGNTTKNADTGAIALGLPPEYAPDAGLFQEGFQLFYDRHRTALDEPLGRRGMLRLGFDLWRERMSEPMSEETEKQVAAEDSTSTHADTDAKETWVWTPDAVFHAIEGRILRGAYLIRRARWFLLLSEASLSWDCRNRESRQMHVIVFGRARPRRREMLPAGAAVPVPPGCRLTVAERKQSFDRKAYDRMRVVTTEIRRLISEGRNVEVRLSRTARLRNAELARLLGWV